MPTRPLSPHLSVYRMSRYTLATSIANRFTGVALSAGLPLLVYWLMAVAGGPQRYARATHELAAPQASLNYAALVAASIALMLLIACRIWLRGMHAP